MKEKILKNTKFILVVLAIALFSMFPYLNEQVPFGHDLGYHLNRINEISNGINIRKIPVLIHSNLIENLGYGNGFFYPQLFLYIPALLVSFTGILVIPAYKIFLVLVAIATFAFMYIAAKNIFKNKYVGWISALLYLFSLYRLTDIYVRAAVGEVISFVFFPLIIYGLYNVIFDDRKKWYVLSIGLAGLAYSHLLSFVMMIPVIIIICLLNIDKIFKNKYVFLKLFIAALVGAILSLAYFGPMIEQKTNDVYNVDGRSIYSSEELKKFSTSVGMALKSNIVGWYATDSNVEQKTMSEGIGIILIIMAGLMLFRKGINYKENRFEIQLFVLGIIGYFCTTKLFPWEKISLFNVIQFPFRLNFIPTVFFALVGANSFYEIIEGKENKRNFVILFSVFYLVYSGYLLSTVEIDFTGWNGNYEVLTGTYDRQVGSAEYLPDGTFIYDLDLYNVHDKENKIEFEKVGSKITFDYDNDQIPMEINTPLVYYKGFVAYIEDENGEITYLQAEKNQGNAHVFVKGDNSLKGKITVEYRLTTVQKISYVISIISLIIFTIYIIYDFISEEFKNKLFDKIRKITKKEEKKS